MASSDQGHEQESLDDLKTLGLFQGPILIYLGWVLSWGGAPFLGVPLLLSSVVVTLYCLKLKIDDYRADHQPPASKYENVESDPDSASDNDEEDETLSNSYKLFGYFFGDSPSASPRRTEGSVKSHHSSLTTSPKLSPAKKSGTSQAGMFTPRRDSGVSGYLYQALDSVNRWVGRGP